MGPCLTPLFFPSQADRRPDGKTNIHYRTAFPRSGVGWAQAFEAHWPRSLGGTEDKFSIWTMSNWPFLKLTLNFDKERLHCSSSALNPWIGTFASVDGDTGPCHTVTLVLKESLYQTMQCASVSMH